MKYKFKTFPTQFWVNDITAEAKLISETNSSHQSSNRFGFLPFYRPQYMIYNFRIFLPNLEIMMSESNKYSRILKEIAKELDLIF